MPESYATVVLADWMCPVSGVEVAVTYAELVENAIVTGWEYVVTIRDVQGVVVANRFTQMSGPTITVDDVATELFSPDGASPTVWFVWYRNPHNIHNATAIMEM